MKFAKSTLAAATALAASMGSAFAAAPLASHDVVLHISGATALNSSIKNMVATYCGTTTAPQLYRKIVSGVPDSNWAAYECTLTNNPADAEYPLLLAKGLNGKTMLIYHTTKVNAELGGSILGVMPIYRTIPMEYVTPETACTANGTEVNGGVTFTRWSCTNSHYATSDVGVSDVSPDVFEGVNLSNATLDPSNQSIDTAAEVVAWSSPLTATEKAAVNTKPALAVGFGVAANTNLAGAGVTSLTRDQFASILAGKVDFWDQMFPENAALAGQPVTVCRRTQGSGTQASYNAFFNNNPCGNSNGTALSVADGSSTGVFGALTVVENSASSDVRVCLANANTAGAYAVGNLSLESLPTTGWTFLGLDGVNPYDVAGDVNDGESDGIREELIASSQYGFYEESTMQWKNTLSDLPGNPKLTLANLLRDNAGNPVIANQLRAVLAAASVWHNPSFPAYSADTNGNGIADAREYPAVMATGIMEYTRNGNACLPSSYLP